MERLLAVVDDIELGARLVFGEAAPGDQYPAPLPYRDPDMPEKLRFGYYLSGEYVTAFEALLPQELAIMAVMNSGTPRTRTRPRTRI